MVSRLSRPVFRACNRVRLPRGHRGSQFSTLAARPPVAKKLLIGGALAITTIGYTISLSQVEAEEKDKKKGGVDLKAIKKDILKIIDNDDYDDGSYGPILIRLAWHSSGTYDKKTKTGGSNGAGMRFTPESDWGGNAGLAIARGLLEPVKKKHPEISYSDLWIYAGYVALEAMGGPAIPFRLGRVDHVEGKLVPLPDGLLPDATKGPQHLRDNFYRMGFNDQEIVALSGAHGVGRCHPERTGYIGPWTNSPTTFSNEFFRLLLEEKWVKEKSPGGHYQFWDEKTHTLMMLPTDLALIEDSKFREWVEKYKDNDKLFFADFASAFKKLTELGVPAFGNNFWSQLWNEWSASSRK